MDNKKLKIGAQKKDKVVAAAEVASEEREKDVVENEKCEAKIVNASVEEVDSDVWLATVSC